MDSMIRQKDMPPEDEFPSSQRGYIYQVIYYWGGVKAIANSFRKNEAAGPKQKQCSCVDVSG